MPIGKAIIFLTLVMLFISIISCHCAVCGGGKQGTLTVLKGSLLPEKQGWSVSTNTVTPLDVTTDGRVLTLNTIGVPRSHDKLSGKAFMWFYKEIPFDLNSRFTIEFILKVHETEQPHNLYDAGIMFYGSTDLSSGSFTEGPRDQM